MTQPLPMHGGQLRAIASRYGLKEKQLLDFSANIQPDGPPVSVMTALASALGDRSVITSYPDLEHHELKASIGGAIHVPGTSLAIANGFVPLLEAFLEEMKVRRCLLPVPAFLEYRRVLTQHSVDVVASLLREDCRFSYDLDGLLDEAVRAGADTILLANPQNPSGVLAPASRLSEFVQRATQKNIRILLDEAFIDYAPSESLAAAAPTTPNLVVFRSVTKFYAMPGLRVAYAVGHPTLVAAAANRIAPWAVSTLAAIAVSAALKDGDYAQQALNQNLAARQQLATGLAELGHTVFPSSANFLLIRLAAGICAKSFWERMIREQHIVLRACANYEGLDARHYRIAVRSAEENLRLLQAMSAFRAGTR
ncbi:pyridoxal phosphate-dependent aminotransferase [Silvibacterium acidisoli]|uniref:pyridoxal phosphate-dependent aminotransferase n=1 Tax=Acidobacteriaceae bacterium ZG23-2 TaxID=2883246 RepID=UPI00406C5EF0